MLLLNENFKNKGENVQFSRFYSTSFIFIQAKLNMREGDEYEDRDERRNVRYEYRQLITDTERMLMPNVMFMKLYNFIRTYIALPVYWYIF